jgi:hypothetical protein
VVAVYSLSQAQPLKVGNFSARFVGFENKQHLSDWKFTAGAGAPVLPPAQAPLVPPAVEAPPPVAPVALPPAEEQAEAKPEEKKEDEEDGEAKKENP